MRRAFAGSAVLAVLLVASGLSSSAQEPANPDPVHRDWHAGWITHPTAPLKEPIVLHFRHTLTLAAVPASYPVRVSADNRFILYVNGKRVGDGPARGDLAHWRYERFDLTPLLKAGENLITATAWNFGIYAPVAQVTDRTAFLLESEASGDLSISTPKGWMVEQETGQRPLQRPANGFYDYMAAGPGEELNAATYDWNWNSTAAGSAWVAAATAIRESIYEGVNRAHSADTTGDNPWGLVPDELPHMEFSATSPGAVVRTNISAAPPAASSQTAGSGPIHISVHSDSSSFKQFPAAPVSVPPATHIHLLLDRRTLTTAYPILTVSGGKGARIMLTYSEALYDKQMHKGDRDDVGDRKAYGTTDTFLPDGELHRSFEPLWWRTWRYLDLDIETAADPITLESLTADFTAYPFAERATFKTGDPDLDKIWEVSWRTARLDAHETYMDTPYYEQLQYIGDTRIQALISYSVAGDDRLGRQALQAFDWSRTPEGITTSRYPSSLPQLIPTFSLLYIGMLHDYWMYRPDAEFARKLVPGTRTILTWYAGYEQPDGLLRKLPWWSFIDWVQGKQEIPTYDVNGESCVTTLEYLGALKDASELEKSLGDPAMSAQYASRAAHVRDGLYAKCWSKTRGLIADTPEQKSFSQQASILAVLYDVIPKDQQEEVLAKVTSIEPGTTPDGVLSASYYFRFYLARALDHAGMADEYLDSIGPWRKLLPLHFSTWPEVPGNTRSDSHAWSAHPIYDFLTLVAGIEPAGPGFGTVRIAPHLGNLPALTASYPHPQGKIEVDYRYSGNPKNAGVKGGSTFHAKVNLPGSLSGSFEFDGRNWPLKPGQNSIDIPMK